MDKYLSSSQIIDLISAVGHKRTVIVEGEKFRRLTEQEIQAYIGRLPGAS